VGRRWVTVRLAALLPVVAALLLAGCGGDEVTSFQDADRSAGKELFVANCGSCHTLADAATAGTVGPNLDQAFGYSCRQGFAEDTVYSIVHGQIDLAQGAMPADIVTGQDAVDVAAYVASVAGKDIEGCNPSGDQGGTTTETTSGSPSG
jgi:mono/diheme cytochrome c family protein